MIKITAKDEGETIAMSCEMKGVGIEMVEEAFAIIVEVPKRLREANPGLYHALMLKIAAEAGTINLEEEEEDADGLN